MPAASSIYWNSVESNRSSGNVSEPTSSSSGTSRHYVDPWDLENYAYLRRYDLPTSHEDSSIPDNPVKSSQRNQSPSDSYYWYPMMTTREPDHYDRAITFDESPLYVGRPKKRIERKANSYSGEQPIYEVDERYVVPNPVYAPISDLEQPDELAKLFEPSEQPRRRSKLSRARSDSREESPCPFHGPLENEPPPQISATRVIPPKQLGLNTYGHLKIDYARSWNSLHRKMSNK